MKWIPMLFLGTLLHGCVALDNFNTANPTAVPVEDAVEIGAEVTGDTLLDLPVGTLETTLGTTKAPTNVTTK